ncbi:MAG: VWA domain-containing protein [Saprospiraceae bacterium]|nr:VWA domain-containing protein [Saprospiraceae bacterium]
MKRLIFIFGLLALVVLSNSCKDDDAEFSDCWQEPKKTQLKFTLLEGPDISLPSKVSIFFKVTDENNNPVGYLTEDDFIIYEKGVNDSCPRKISEFEAERKISGREQVFNHSTLLVLDLSGSVLQQSLQQVKDAANAFVDQIVPPLPDPSISMGIYWFDGEDVLHELEPVTTSLVDLKNAINGISPNISTDNSTDLYGAVIKVDSKADSILALYKAADVTSATSIVLFTDGEDRANRYPKQSAYDVVAQSPKEISWFTLGVGNEINAIDLQKIGRNGFFQAASISKLTEVFKQIANVVNNEANSYYFFEYCSPIRSGDKNGLIIEANIVDDNEIGFLQTVFDATGFTGGCQL